MLSSAPVLQTTRGQGWGASNARSSPEAPGRAELVHGRSGVASLWGTCHNGVRGPCSLITPPSKTTEPRDTSPVGPLDDLFHILRDRVRFLRQRRAGKGFSETAKCHPTVHLMEGEPGQRNARILIYIHPQENSASVQDRHHSGRHQTVSQKGRLNLLSCLSSR